MRRSPDCQPMQQLQHPQKRGHFYHLRGLKHSSLLNRGAVNLCRAGTHRVAHHESCLQLLINIYCTCHCWFEVLSTRNEIRGNVVVRGELAATLSKVLTSQALCEHNACKTRNR